MHRWRKHHPPSGPRQAWIDDPKPEDYGINQEVLRSKPDQMPRKPKEDQLAQAPTRFPDVLDAHGAAALLTVSADLVYKLFASGELPGRKVGRKWLTTKSAVLRWVESSSGDAAMSRAIRNGDTATLFSAMNRGKVRAVKRV